MKHKKSIEPLIAIVILVAIAISLALIFSFWILGILGSTGYGTQPVKLALSEYYAVGSIAMFNIKNIGGSDVLLTNVFVNGLPVDVLTAFEYNTLEKRISWDDGSYVVRLKPGELVQLWIALPENEYFKPGTLYNLKVVTSGGQTFYYDIEAKRLVMVEPYLDIYVEDVNTTYHLDFMRRTWKAFNGTPQQPGTLLREGKLEFIEQTCISLKDNPDLMTSPFIVAYIPPKLTSDTYIWNDHHKGAVSSAYYHIEVIPKTVPYMDYLVFFEDSWLTGTPPGWINYNDHVFRVTWTKLGSVTVKVYYGSHEYTYDVYVGGKFAYKIRGYPPYQNITDPNYAGPCATSEIRDPLTNKTFVINP